MVTDTENGDAAGQSMTDEAVAKQQSLKKSVTKKTASKKKSAKKSATKKTGAARGATKAATTKRVKSVASAQRQQAKAEEERTQYLTKIEANELRLRDGKTSNEQPLTPEQVKTTQDILTRQREHLAELESYVAANSDDPRT